MTAKGLRRVLVTGGAGFLGSHFVRAWLGEGLGEVVNLDLLTYAGTEARLADVRTNRGYRFARADVAEPDAVGAVLAETSPEVVVHFAAESHVTRSERDAERFHRTNVTGTRVLLEAAARQGVQRFIHISTDEVYGPILEGAFREEDKEPGDRQATSPYAKSKALADDLAASFRGLEVVVVRPTNCFGPWQFPEKAFARWVTRALRGEPIPVWGDGRYVRQWLAAEDLAAAVLFVAWADRPEPVYNVGPRHQPEITNLDLARWLADHLGLPPDRVVLTEYDRPDHDRRYAVDPSRIEALGWRAADPWERFAMTVEWYRGAESWWKPLVEEAESIYSDDRRG
jgi:dTDP-glucose 4,6-dehydratase